MLPTLMPAIASCSARVRVIMRGRHSREGGNPVAAERKTLGPRVRGDDGSPSQSVGLFAPLRLLVSTEDVALPGARPRHRFPLAILHHHWYEREVADVVLGRKRPRRGDGTHAVILNAFQRTDQSVRG